MSLRNRARSLQRKTGLGYQQALARLRALGDRPAQLARETRWPLEVCDRFLVDGHAPIDVVDAPPRPVTRREQLQAICQHLLVTSAALAVMVTDKQGHPLAHAGGDLSSGIFFAPRFPGREIVELGDGTQLASSAWSRGHVVACFDERTSLGLVRLRLRQAAEALDELFADAGSGMPPPGGAFGPGGPPAETFVFKEIPEPPTKPAPRPPSTGRRRIRSKRGRL